MSRKLILASVCLASTAAFLYAQDATAKRTARTQATQNSQSDASSRTAQDDSTPPRAGAAGQGAAGQATSGRGAPGRSGQSAGQSQVTDHLIATCIALGNQEEIALSELAKQKSQNEQVKKFAEMMVKDHHEFLTKLQRYAPEASRPGILEGKGGQGRPGQGAGQGRGAAAKSTEDNSDTNPNAAQDNDSNAAQSDQSSSKSSTTNRGKIQQTGGTEDSNRAGAQGSATLTAGQSIPASQITQIEQELAAQCLASARKKLNEKDDAEFDKCFMGLQVAKHMAMKDKLTVYQRHASSELAQVLAEGEKTTEHHLQQAEEIIRTIAHSSGSTSSDKNDKSRESNPKGNSSPNKDKSGSQE